MSKALELADAVKEAWVSGHLSYDVADDAAAELRRLAAVEAKRDALKAELDRIRAMEPVAWRTFDGEGGYDYRTYDMNEDYAEDYAKRNPKYAHWVEPLYTLEKP